MEVRFYPTNETPIAVLTVGQFKELIGTIVYKEPEKQESQNDFPETFGKKECSLLTGYAVNTINKMICERTIPFYKKNARVIFKKTEIEDWLLSNRIQTKEEFAEEAENNLINRRNKK